MADTIRSFSIFLASPGGLEVERRVFAEQVEEWNKTVGQYHGVQFRVLRWEDVPPGAGRAQERINRLVKESDYFVLTMHDRWGSPPGPTSTPSAPTSGTEEEFRLAEQCRDLDSRPMRDIAPVFKAVAPNQLADPGDKLKPVIEFKKQIQSSYSHLYREFDELEQFRVIVRGLLCYWGLPPKNGGDALIPITSVPPEGATPATEVDALSRVETLLTQSSSLVTEAERLANEGKLVEAEVTFAETTTGRADLDAINRFGHFLHRLGRLSQAEMMYTRLSELSGTDESNAIALGNLGLIEQTRGNLAAAEDYHTRSLAINEELGRKEGMAAALGNLGLIELTRGNLNAAEDYLKRSLAIHESLGHKEGVANQLGNLGLIEQTRGNLAAAEDYHTRSLAINEELGRKEGMAAALGNLGGIELSRRNLNAAEDYLKRSLAINESLGNREGMAANLGNLGLVERSRENLSGAEDYLKRSLAIHESLGNREGMANQLGNLGLVERRRENLSGAEDYLKRSLAIHESLGHKEGMANQFGNLGVIDETRGNLNAAREKWMRSRDLFREIGMSHMVERVQRWLDELPKQ
ncbi:MAG: tetratricopeptide repeat protein [Phycisphaerales bacterium]|jgi:tetratricopeptide (TPR) repeat protein|nr:tetratricopeptide repeat protein [Phycisphaerales bacterium]